MFEVVRHVSSSSRYLVVPIKSRVVLVTILTLNFDSLYSVCERSPRGAGVLRTWISSSATSSQFSIHELKKLVKVNICVIMTFFSDYFL